MQINGYEKSGEVMTRNSVLLDTSFFIRFLTEGDPLFENANGYYKYFLDNEIEMLISTISIGEYCVKGELNELPLKDLQIIPFNIDHAVQSGRFASIVFNHKGSLSLSNRNLIPNDTKLFAQANIIAKYYLSSDSESLKIYNLLKNKTLINFDFIDLNTPHSETFGVIGFPSEDKIII